MMTSPEYFEILASYAECRHSWAFGQGRFVPQKVWVIANDEGEFRHIQIVEINAYNVYLCSGK
jgi:hypothetical protein